MNEREYWKPHVRSKRFPAIRYAVSSLPISPGSYIKITGRGENPSLSQEVRANNSELENEVPNRRPRGAMTVIPSTLRRNRMLEQARSSDSHWLPSVRSVTASHRLRDIPGIYVIPAPKYARKTGRTGTFNSAMLSKTYYNRSTRNDSRRPDQGTRNFTPEILSQHQPVTIPVLDGLPNEEDASDCLHSNASPSPGLQKIPNDEQQPPPLRETNSANFYPKLVNLNQNFADISSKFGGKVALNVALSRKFVAHNRALENEPLCVNPKSRNQLPATSPRYLPLREVYLKGALTEDKDQEVKTTRILNWLKKLNYLEDAQQNSKTTERAQ